MISISFFLFFSRQRRQRLKYIPQRSARNMYIQSLSTTHSPPHVTQKNPPAPSSLHPPHPTPTSPSPFLLPPAKVPPNPPTKTPPPTNNNNAPPPPLTANRLSTNQPTLRPLVPKKARFPDQPKFFFSFSTGVRTRKQASKQASPCRCFPEREREIHLFPINGRAERHFPAASKRGQARIPPSSTPHFSHTHLPQPRFRAALRSVVWLGRVDVFFFFFFLRNNQANPSIHSRNLWPFWKRGFCREECRL
jgi:hypothetical protein